MHIAASENNASWLNSLIANAADINQRTTGGETPLMKAARFDSDKCAKILIKHGCDLRAKDKCNNTAYNIAVENHSMKVQDILWRAITRIKDASCLSCKEPISNPLEALKEVIIRFIDENDTPLGDEITVSTTENKVNLNTLINNYKKMGQKDYTDQIYCLTLLGKSINSTISEVLIDSKFNAEKVLDVQFIPEEPFYILPVTRASTTLQEHLGEILTVAFSADSKDLATGSADKTIRLWDLSTETPYKKLEGHTAMILCVSWSPDCSVLATGDRKGSVGIWERNGALRKLVKVHADFVCSISWKPMHLDVSCKYFATSSKDTTVKIVNSTNGDIVRSLSSHSSTISQVIWSGENKIFTGSHDKTIKVWDGDSFKFEKELKGHGHWVNTMALNVDYALKKSCYDHTAASVSTDSEKLAKSKANYLKAKGEHNEILATGSDDMSILLWEPLASDKPVHRLTGHQALVNHIMFSPNGKLLASASFDKSIKVWESYTGKYKTSLRAHVGSVYRIAWSADSRLLVSASKDSTLKVWDIPNNKLLYDLPGHSDEIYCVDWSPNGEKVASGSKDHVLRIWKN